MIISSSIKRFVIFYLIVTVSAFGLGLVVGQHIERQRLATASR